MSKSKKRTTPYYAVAVQPANDVEEQAMRDAMEACPQRCIKDYGDE